MHHQAARVLAIAATCLLGIMAGFFFAFAIDIVPAMEHLDASSYINTQQWINRVVRNATFGATYFGSALLPFLAAAAAFWCGQRRTGVGWLLLALVYFGAVFWLTRAVNVPINNELASWQSAAPPANWQQARDAWNQSNLVRSVASVACFVVAVILVSVSRPSAAEA